MTPGQETACEGQLILRYQVPELQVPSPLRRGMRDSAKDVVGRRNGHLSASSAPSCECERKAAARSWQPLPSLRLLHGPPILVPLREQLMSSGLQFWGAAWLTAAIHSAAPASVTVNFPAFGGY